MITFSRSRGAPQCRRRIDTDLRPSEVCLQAESLRLIAEQAFYCEQMYAHLARRFGTERLGKLLRLLHERETCPGGLTGELEDSPGTARKRRTSP